jgi:hypothetical protein
MALDVWIGHWDEPDSSLEASFDPEAWYWFLRPLFEGFAETHGTLIDPWDGAAFEPDELPAVAELFDYALALVRTKPERFDVHVGTLLTDPPRKQFVAVEREPFLAFLATVRGVVDRCAAAGKPMLFHGD